MAKKKKRAIDLGGPVPEHRPELKDVLPPPPAPRGARSSPENELGAPPPPDDREAPLPPPDDSDLPPPPEDDEEAFDEPVGHAAASTEPPAPEEERKPEASGQPEGPSTPPPEEYVTPPEAEAEPQEPGTEESAKPKKRAREKQEKHKKKGKKAPSKRVVIEPEFPVPPDYAVSAPEPAYTGDVAPIPAREQKLERKRKKQAKRLDRGAYERAKKVHFPTLALVVVKGILIIYFIYALFFFGILPAQYVRYGDWGMTVVFFAMMMGVIVKAVCRVRSRTKGEILYVVAIIAVGFAAIYLVQYLAEVGIIEPERAEILSVSVAGAAAFGSAIRYILDSLSRK